MRGPRFRISPPMPNAGSSKLKGGRGPLFFLFWALFSAVFLFIIVDNARPPRQQVMVKWSVSVLDYYKISISRPLAAHNVKPCRFHPTCSVYARTAILRFGFLKGGAMAFVRVLKCNPFYGRPPIEDPVPPGPGPAGSGAKPPNGGETSSRWFGPWHFMPLTGSVCDLRLHASMAASHIHPRPAVRVPKQQDSQPLHKCKLICPCHLSA